MCVVAADLEAVREGHGRKMTISSIADALSELKAIPVMMPKGEIVLRSESGNA